MLFRTSPPLPPALSIPAIHVDHIKPEPLDSAEEESQQNADNYYHLSGNPSPKIEPVEDACYLLPVGAALDNFEQQPQYQAMMPQKLERSPHSSPLPPNTPSISMHHQSSSPILKPHQKRKVQMEKRETSLLESQARDNHLSAKSVESVTTGTTIWTDTWGLNAELKIDSSVHSATRGFPTSKMLQSISRESISWVSIWKLLGRNLPPQGWPLILWLLRVISLSCLWQVDPLEAERNDCFTSIYLLKPKQIKYQ